MAQSKTLAWQINLETCLSICIRDCFLNAVGFRLILNAVDLSPSLNDLKKLSASTRNHLLNEDGHASITY